MLQPTVRAVRENYSPDLAFLGPVLVLAEPRTTVTQIVRDELHADWGDNSSRRWSARASGPRRWRSRATPCSMAPRRRRPVPTTWRWRARLPRASACQWRPRGCADGEESTPGARPAPGRAGRFRGLAGPRPSGRRTMPGPCWSSGASSCPTPTSRARRSTRRDSRTWPTAAPGGDPPAVAGSGRRRRRASTSSSTGSAAGAPRASPTSTRCRSSCATRPPTCAPSRCWWRTCSARTSPTRRRRRPIGPQRSGLRRRRDRPPPRYQRRPRQQEPADSRGRGALRGDPAAGPDEGSGAGVSCRSTARTGRG